MFKHSLLSTVIFFITMQLFAQAELEPWGNISGIRIDGQLMEFQTNLCVVQNNWKDINTTAKEKQRPHYTRNGYTQTVLTNLDSLYFTEDVTDKGKGVADVNVQLTAKADMALDGAYISLILSAKNYAEGSIKINDLKKVKLSENSSALDEYLETPATSVQFVSPSRQLKITFQNTVNLIIKKEPDNDIHVFIPIQKGDIKSGEVVTQSFSVKASGLIDKKPITLVLNTTKTGRAFDGLGGNFRLQNPKIDPEVIDYCLKNLRVAWGRVEMPWMFWQPDMNTDPIAAAKAGKLNHHVQQSMEMAQRLHKMGIPLILSAWFPPQWAVVGPLHFRPTPDHVWGNPLDHSKTKEIYKSIADYIQYLKDEYGVEIADFSFNESDLGINIRQTGEEQDELIKGLGAYFVERGLKTKLLLGDNSDATTFQFIVPALNDPATYPYIGAVSFHSWRGWDTPTLQKWADAATKIHRPLIIAEGSIDAQAWGYPDIFKEPTYALQEINLYVRLLSICQPLSILQWQLTSDYSLLAGGGVYGDTSEPLHPTQRFWNLKQLASTPKDLKAMPLKIEGDNVSGAALGDNVRGIYVIHLVNNDAERKVTLTGLPHKIKYLRVWVTDKNSEMKKEKQIPVINGKSVFALTATAYTTLMSE
ncbi:MAG TPA: hypothetical protein VFI29_12625 [Hanamia sp.]|nr:hypothetical protein [Hanamia sp.]